ncbi:hypothetical protein HPB47_022992 [Ixodes persulcatus]|uniref:Uncharacterized protein n=1 Tax=Ixodes persulcatus TaxID=34615 RepID=A0AC60QBD3_IXOPE|nr:hypothetical protein HPB47_022992 [Ixodes persulcatus]
MSATHPTSPPKTQAFDVGKAESFSIQHLEATNFQITVLSKPAMAKIISAEGLTIGGARVSIVPVGPQVTTVTCLFLPVYISNDDIVAALSPYGKVLEVPFGVYQDHITIKTGTRYVRMEMLDSNPVPSFLCIAGHRATFDYRGIRRMCRRVTLRLPGRTSRGTWPFDASLLAEKETVQALAAGIAQPLTELPVSPNSWDDLKALAGLLENKGLSSHAAERSSSQLSMD